MIAKKSNRYFTVETKAGTLTFRDPSYSVVLPFFDSLPASMEGKTELQQMLFMSKAIALFWCGEEPMDADDPMDTLQDLGCDFADITLISKTIFERLTKAVQAIGEAQDTKNV